MQFKFFHLPGNKQKDVFTTHNVFIRNDMCMCNEFKIQHIKKDVCKSKRLLNSATIGFKAYTTLIVDVKVRYSDNTTTYLPSTKILKYVVKHKSGKLEAAFNISH